jgi:nitroreductase
MPHEPAVHPLLAERWSPAAFDPEHEVSDEQIESLLEAARWAPSAGNSQPWSFLACRRGDAVHADVVGTLAPSSARWAPDAGLLVVNLCHRWVDGTEWDYSEFADYDLGQAVAHMTIQGVALGLASRQFRAFDLDALTGVLDVPPHWVIRTMTAFGRAATGPTASAARRTREDVRWGSPDR